MYNTPLIVYVGSGKKRFDLHREILCSTSPVVAEMLDGKGQERERRRVRYVRHKLQKVLFPKGRQPKNVVREVQASSTPSGLKADISSQELLAADGLLKKLEGLGELHATNIKSTRIHKVLKAALKSADVPSFDSWSIKKRGHLLLTTYERGLKQATPAQETTGKSSTGDDAKASISLPNASEAAFELFVFWLYRKQLGCPGRGQDGVAADLTPTELVELYTLADFLRVPSLQDEIGIKMESISPNLEAYRGMFLFMSANPTTESTLFEIVVRLYAQHVTPTEVRRAAADWMEKEVLVEVTAFLLRENAKGKGGK